MRLSYWLLLVRIASHNTQLIKENRKLKIDLADALSAYNTQKWLTEKYKNRSNEKLFAHLKAGNSPDQHE